MAIIKPGTHLPGRVITKTLPQLRPATELRVEPTEPPPPPSPVATVETPAASKGDS
jgi:hypothetical protein